MYSGYYNETASSDCRLGLPSVYYVTKPHKTLAPTTTHIINSIHNVVKPVNFIESITSLNSINIVVKLTTYIRTKAKVVEVEKAIVGEVRYR